MNNDNNRLDKLLAHIKQSTENSEKLIRKVADLAFVKRTEKYQREFKPVKTQAIAGQVFYNEISDADEFEGMVYPNKLIMVMAMANEGSTIDSKN